jgi:predicted MFS family arabinose efflux permease
MSRPFTSHRRYYVLAVVLIIYIFNFIDRQLLAILLPYIKKDLAVSDTLLGFLTGTAFALFYVTLGFPAAWLADRGWRREVLSFAVFLWSFMTAATGFARNFIEMLLLRIGVGVGEAGCTPPAHAIIAENFPREERGRAMGIYMTGFSLGVFIAFFAGGWIGEHLGWRAAFIYAGAPGILLALLAWFSIPRSRPATSGSGTTSVGAALRFLRSQRSFVHLCLANAIANGCYIGAIQWLPSFFVRSHGLGTAEIGRWLAIAIGVFGGCGTVFGGWIADRLGLRDLRWYMATPAIAMLIALPFVSMTLLAESSTTAFQFYLVPSFFIAMGAAPCYATTQALARPEMRALASATMLFVTNVFSGLGPQVVGILSDALAPAYGSDSLRYAMLIVLIAGSTWPVAHYRLAARSLRADVGRAGPA